MSTTTQIHIEPHALVIGLSDEHLVLCHEIVGNAGLRVDVARSGVETACERIPRGLPQMVVASARLGSDAIAMLEDRAMAVGAVFLLLGDRLDLEATERQLEASVGLAAERFRRRSSRPPS